MSTETDAGSVTDEELLARFAPLFERVREGSADRDRTGELPLDLMAELRLAGIGALRVPTALGGGGVSLRQLFVVLRALAAADSNLPQALRQHYFQVELLLLTLDDTETRVWIERVVAGDIFGSATTEPRGSKLGAVATVLSRDASGGYRLNGRKIYGTGNAYAQWLPVGAVDEAGVPVIPVVPIDRAGVSLLEDWDGFGQRLTATSTTILDNVRVEEAEVKRFPVDGPARGGSGFHQTVLLATLAGIAEAASGELVDILRAKTRVYFTGTGELPRDDAVVQEQVGRIQAAADAARWVVDGLARQLEASWKLWADPGADATEVDDAFVYAELAVASAQVTVSELVLNATSHLLDVLGASSLSTEIGLDRHWRNARAVASHNPYPFKARLLGDHLLTGAEPSAFAVGRDVGDKR